MNADQRRGFYILTAAAVIVIIAFIFKWLA
jgi:hypothetical protein